MKKILLILLIISGLYRIAIAQDFPYSKITEEELDMKSYDKDTRS